MLEFVDILQKAKRNYQEKNYQEAFLYYEKIQNCPRFHSTEANLYEYSYTIYQYCKDKDILKECRTQLLKSTSLLQKAIELLKPEDAFFDLLYERYFLLGHIYFELSQCLEAKKAFRKAYSFKKTNEAFQNWQNLQKLCP
ncbi:MAG: hypothetical protein NZ853_05780 [Leptospiraceae bacterium]|nr:hypothetical protein [Leptospiraceae bacterium]